MITGIVLNNKTIIEIPDNASCEQLQNICDILATDNQESQFIKNINYVNSKCETSSLPSEASFDILMRICIAIMILIIMLST